jgi:carbonic anhydrase
MIIGKLLAWRNLSGGAMVHQNNACDGQGMSEARFPQRLLDGYSTFRTGRLPTEQSRYRELAERGQSPETMVIGCCDSRVSPEVIFDAGPGELFVMRNVANLVPPYSPDDTYHGVSAAVEYAVTVLHVQHIVVLGHARCGGIRAFADNSPHLRGEFIGKWMTLIAPTAVSIAAREEAPGNYHTRLEQASLVASLANLMTFPFVLSACERKQLSLHGAYFDVASGELATFAPASGRFVALTPSSASPG